MSKQRNGESDRRPFSCRLPSATFEALEELSSTMAVPKTEVLVMAIALLQRQPEIAQIAKAKKRLLNTLT